MNNKGFVTSFILFSLLIFFLLVISIVLFTMNNSSSLNNKLKNDLASDIDDIELNSSSFDSSDIYVVKTRGTYKVQVWSGEFSGQGKYYSEGLIKLERGDKLYININTPNIEVLKNNNQDHFIKIKSDIKQINGSFYNKIEPTNDSSKIPTDNEGITPFVIIKGVVTAEDVAFDDTLEIGCEDTQCALEEISNIINKKTICRRATSSELHTYNGMTYGQIGTKGQLHSGDAFVCDVNGDGTYNSENEMFYYVSDYYDTSIADFDDKYVTLLYYTNVNNGSPSDNSSTAYNKNDISINGPVTAYKQLPTEVQWPNVKLKAKKRLILNEQGTRTINGEENKTKFFNYKEYAARFLTYQELKSGCPTISNIQNSSQNCKYLLEKTKFVNEDYSRGYWLENPNSSSESAVYYVDSDTLNSTGPWPSEWFGVRPVIDVKKTYLEY